jgi:spermidine synthase
MDRWIDESLYQAWGQRLKVSRVLFEERTEHQHLVIFENDALGRVMMPIISTCRCSQFPNPGTC